MVLAVAPDECPDAQKDHVEKLHSSLKTLLIAKKIPWVVMAKLGEEGYVTIEDLGDRWNTPQEARDLGPRDLGPRELDFAPTATITDAESKFFRHETLSMCTACKSLHTGWHCSSPGAAWDILNQILGRRS